jgi:hypothetical protein
MKAIFYRDSKGRRTDIAIKVIGLLKQNKEGIRAKQVYELVDKENLHVLYETLYGLKSLEIIRKSHGIYTLSKGFYIRLQNIMATLEEEEMLPTKAKPKEEKEIEEEEYILTKD